MHILGSSMYPIYRRLNPDILIVHSASVSPHYVFAILGYECYFSYSRKGFLVLFTTHPDGRLLFIRGLMATAYHIFQYLNATPFSSIRPIIFAVSESFAKKRLGEKDSAAYQRNPHHPENSFRSPVPVILTLKRSPTRTTLQRGRLVCDISFETGSSLSISLTRSACCSSSSEI